MTRIGIFGGSFNPVHNEHIELAVNAVKELNLDKLYIVPTLIAPHKSSIPAPEQDRLNMLKLAFSGQSKIEVSDFEIGNGGKSYTYITVEHFKKITGAEIFLLVGEDMFENFKFWKYPERILKNATLCVSGRKEFATNIEKERQYLEKTYNAKIEFLSFCGTKQSSTKIRVYNSLGLDISLMTNSAVANYIKEHNLYCGGKEEDYIKSVLPEKRLIHTANVIVCALKKCKELMLDPEKVRLSALLHDNAKYADLKDYPDFKLEEEVPSPVIHAFLGEYIAREKLKIKDEEVLSAIKYHTSGKPNMTLLEKLIFVADMIEDGRDYQGVDKLREFYREDLEKCFRECLKEEVLHLTNRDKGAVFHLTLDAYEYYK